MGMWRRQSEMFSNDSMPSQSIRLVATSRRAWCALIAINPGALTYVVNGWGNPDAAAFFFRQHLLAFIPDHAGFSCAG